MLSSMSHLAAEDIESSLGTEVHPPAEVYPLLSSGGTAHSSDWIVPDPVALTFALMNLGSTPEQPSAGDAVRRWS